MRSFFEVSDWTVQHPLAADRLVAKHSNFTVRRGEVVGFAGLMGAGRTELAMSLFGRSYGVYLSGQIIKDGKEIELKNVGDAIEHGLAYVSEDRKALGLNLLDDIKTLHRGRQALARSRSAASSTRSTSSAPPSIPQEPAHQDAERR